MSGFSSAVSDNYGEIMAAGRVNAALADWFENDFHSPAKFPVNGVTALKTKPNENWYTMTALPVEIVGDSKAHCVCASSIKANNEKFGGFELPEDDGTNTPLLTEGSNGIFIYGHTDDVDDEFGSRIDTAFLEKFSPDVNMNVFNVVSVSGAFENPDIIQPVLCALFKRFASPRGCMMRVFLSSKAYDSDSKKARTLANMIAEGYIRPQIVMPDGRAAQYVYHRLDPKMTARLFTKTLTNDIFENIELKYDNR